MSDPIEIKLPGVMPKVAIVMVTGMPGPMRDAVASVLRDHLRSQGAHVDDVGGEARGVLDDCAIYVREVDAEVPARADMTHESMRRQIAAVNKDIIERMGVPAEFLLCLKPVFGGTCQQVKNHPGPCPCPDEDCGA